MVAENPSEERNTSRIPLPLSRFLHYAVVGLVFLYLLHMGWHRWGDLVVDTYNDQWTALQLYEGKKLYADLEYTYGFLPTETIALLHGIFGVHLDNTIGVGIVLCLACAWLFYRITRLFLGRTLSVIGVLHFLFPRILFL